jgi:flagellar motor switch protein FliG
MAKEKTLIIDDISDEKFPKKISEQYEIVNEKTFKILEDFVTSDYEETFAKILVYLPEERRRTTIQKMPEAIQKRVSELLDSYSTKKNSDPDILSTVGFVLKNANFYGPKVAEEFLGKNSIAFMKFMQENATSLFEKNPLLSMNLEYYLITLDILTMMDDRSVQRWLREVSIEDLAKALKGSSEEVKNKVFQNMTKRAAAMLEEDMEFMGPIRKSNIFDTQSKLVKILYDLGQKGEIMYPICSDEVII